MQKYLLNDVKYLYEIIDKISNLNYDLERINITKVISISSLALNTYLSNYYPLPVIDKKKLKKKRKIKKIILK